MKHLLSKSKTIAVLALSLLTGISVFSGVVTTNKKIEQAHASTSVSNTRIFLQIIDSDSKSGYNNDMWIHCWNVTVDTTYSVFNNISDANSAGALTGLGYNSSDGSLDFCGTYSNWHGSPGGNYGTGNYRSYCFAFPWFITGFEYKVRVSGSDCKYSKSMTGHAKVVKTFWTNSGWDLDNNDKESSTSYYDVTAYNMTFETNGGTNVHPTNPYVFKQYQKTTEPSAENQPYIPHKIFQKWTTTNSASAAAYTFGSNLTSDITLYAQYTDDTTNNVLVWKDDTKTNAYTWFKNSTTGDNTPDANYPGTRGSTVTIDGTTYRIITGVSTKANMVIFNNGDPDKTGDIPIDPGAFGGTMYYDVSEGRWKELSTSIPNLTIPIEWKDIGGGSYTGTDSRDSSFHYAQNYTVTDGTKNGYTFSGWYDNPACTGSAITSLSKYTYGSTVTLYAKWTANTNTPYKVEHYQQNINDDNYTLKDTDNLAGTTGQQTNAQTKSYTGFTNIVFSQQTIAGDGTTKVKIYYDRIKYTVSFNMNGHGTQIDSQQVRYLGTASEPATPSVEGWSFEGWFNGGNLFDFSTTISDNVELTAHWTQSANPEADAIAFAQQFLDDIGGTCHYDGSTNTETLKTNWRALAVVYSPLDDEVKAYFIGTSVSTNTDIEDCIEMYSYVFRKYWHNGTFTKEYDFLGKYTDENGDIKLPQSTNRSWKISDSEDQTIIIVVISCASLLTLSAGALAVLLKKKKKED